MRISSGLVEHCKGETIIIIIIIIHIINTCVCNSFRVTVSYLQSQCQLFISAQLNGWCNAKKYILPWNFTNFVTGYWEWKQTELINVIICSVLLFCLFCFCWSCSFIFRYVQPVMLWPCLVGFSTLSVHLGDRPWHGSELWVRSLWCASVHAAEAMPRVSQTSNVAQHPPSLSPHIQTHTQSTRVKFFSHPDFTKWL